MQIRTTVLASTLAAGLCASLSAQAAPFGIYDPRSLGMGGVGVTLATARNANFFNPAALAATKDDEDFAFNLTVAARAADPNKLLDDIDNLESTGTTLDQRVAIFTATPIQANAGPLGLAVTDFNNSLKTVNNKALQPLAGDIPKSTYPCLNSKHVKTPPQPIAGACNGSRFRVAIDSSSKQKLVMLFALQGDDWKLCEAGSPS